VRHLHPITCTVFFFLLDDLPPTSSGLLASSSTTVVGSTSLDTPVEDVIVLEALANEQVAEELAEVGVIGLVVEAKSARVIEEDTELVRESAAQQVRGRSHLLLHNSVVLLLLSGCFQPLPGESATQEVHEHVSEGLQVVTTGLFDTQVRVDGRVTSSACEVLVLPIRDVQVGLGVTELFSKPEVDDVDLVASLSNTHQEVVGFYVTVNKIA
jgi:hypothetical protein